MKQKKSTQLKNTWENILLFVIRICSFLLHRVTLPFGKLEHTGVQAVFEVMYKAGKTMPDNISKHREKSWEYDK